MKRLYKWCKTCDKVTEYSKGSAFGMPVEFCKEHRIEPWESIYPIPPIPEATLLDLALLECIRFKFLFGVQR
jgi:hypothetical protein